MKVSWEQGNPPGKKGIPANVYGLIMFYLKLAMQLYITRSLLLDHCSVLVFNGHFGGSWPIFRQPGFPKVWFVSPDPIRTKKASQTPLMMRRAARAARAARMGRFGLGLKLLGVCWSPQFCGETHLSNC